MYSRAVKLTRNCEAEAELRGGPEEKITVPLTVTGREGTPRRADVTNACNRDVRARAALCTVITLYVIHPMS